MVREVESQSRGSARGCPGGWQREQEKAGHGEVVQGPNRWDLHPTGCKGREEPKMTRASNTDRKKGYLNKRNQAARKRGKTLLSSSFGTQSAEVIMGHPQKLLLSVPRFQSIPTLGAWKSGKYLQLEMQGIVLRKYGSLHLERELQRWHQSVRWVPTENLHHCNSPGLGRERQKITKQRGEEHPTFPFRRRHTADLSPLHPPGLKGHFEKLIKVDFLPNRLFQYVVFFGLNL